MKTDDLIRAMAADPAPGRAVFPDVLWMLSLPIFVVGAVHLAASGLRPDLWTALVAPVTVWKWLLPALVAASGLLLAVRLMRPGAAAGQGRLVLWGAVALGLALVAWRLFTLPQDAWAMALRGKTIWFCLASIVGIGLPGLIAALLVMQRGATTRPGLTGMVAGLGCGGLATVIYALHCTEDDPLFFVTWYGAGMVLLGGIGAILGPRLLRW